MRFVIITLVTSIIFSNSAFAEDLVWQDPTEAQMEHLKLGFEEASNLKDPFSIRFRSGVKVGAVSNGNYIYCGYLNAKNSNGAYTGWSRFVVVDSTVKADGSYATHEDGGTWNITIEEGDDFYAKSLIELGCEGYPW